MTIESAHVVGLGIRNSLSVRGRLEIPLSQNAAYARFGTTAENLKMVLGIR
jgi:hypothetical protein